MTVPLKQQFTQPPVNFYDMKRTCKRCHHKRSTAGGKTFPGGSVWLCAACRAKVERKQA